MKYKVYVCRERLRELFETLSYGTYIAYDIPPSGGVTQFPRAEISVSEIYEGLTLRSSLNTFTYPNIDLVIKQADLKFNLIYRNTLDDLGMLILDCIGFQSQNFRLSGLFSLETIQI